MLSFLFYPFFFYLILDSPLGALRQAPSVVSHEASLAPVTSHAADARSARGGTAEAPPLQCPVPRGAAGHARARVQHLWCFYLFLIHIIISYYSFLMFLKLTNFCFQCF